MTIEKQTLTEVEVTTLKVFAGVRYWKDASVNGKEDEDGSLIPFRNVEKNTWEPVIDIDTGIIKDWPKGTSADIHYKVCDNGKYVLEDANGKQVAEYEGYVPDIMSPSGKGYGDYIIIEVDENGKIRDWDIENDLDDFFEGDDD